MHRLWLDFRNNCSYSAAFRLISVVGFCMSSSCLSQEPVDCTSGWFVFCNDRVEVLCVASNADDFDSIRFRANTQLTAANFGCCLDEDRGVARSTPPSGPYRLGQSP